MMASQPPEDVRLHVALESEWRIKVVNKMTADLVRLRRLHNSVALVNRLPPEIFCEVFKYLRTSKGHIADIIRVTHVCQQWRDIALGAPHLWTEFPMNKLGASLAFLERSQSLPLTLFLTQSDKHLLRIAGLAARHISRVQELQLRRYPADLIIGGLGRFTSPVPLLETLVIEKSAQRSPDLLSHDPPIFGGTLPSKSLRTLKIYNMCFLPTFASPSVLVNLEIRQHYYPSLIPSLPSLLSFLRQCPLLETLRLGGRHQGVNTSSGAIVPLPHLQRLRLFLPSDHMHDLLDNLLVPPTAVVRLQIPDIGPGVGYHMIPPSFETQLLFLTGVKRLELVIESHRFTLRGFHTPEEYVEPGFQFELSVSVPGPTLDWSQLLNDWPFDASQVESLVICGPRTPQDEFTLALSGGFLYEFPELAFLRVVSMTSFDTTTLLEWLRHYIDYEEVGYGSLNPDQLVPMMRCPKLTALELFDIQGGENLCESLMLTIGQRADEGQPLRELFLCMVDGLNQEQAEILKASAKGATAVTLDSCEE